MQLYPTELVVFETKNFKATRQLVTSNARIFYSHIFPRTHTKTKYSKISICAIDLKQRDQLIAAEYSF